MTSGETNENAKWKIKTATKRISDLQKWRTTKRTREAGREWGTGATNDYELAHPRTHVVRGRPLLRHLFWSWSPRGTGCIPSPLVPPLPLPPPHQEPVWRFYFPRKCGITVTSAKAIGTMSRDRNVDVGQGRASRRPRR